MEGERGLGGIGTNGMVFEVVIGSNQAAGKAMLMSGQVEEESGGKVERVKMDTSGAGVDRGNLEIRGGRE